MFREHQKKKIANVVSVITLCIVILVLVFIGVFIIADNMSAANASAKENTSVESTEKPVVETTNNLIPNSNFERVSEDELFFTYYRDKVTDVMYICYDEYDSGGLLEMHDPNTGLPLTYQQYLEYQKSNRGVK